MSLHSTNQSSKGTIEFYKSAQHTTLYIDVATDETIFSKEQVEAVKAKEKSWAQRPFDAWENPFSEFPEVDVFEPVYFEAAQETYEKDV